MVDWGVVWNFVTMIVVAVGAYLLFLLKEGTNAAVRTSAEEAAKATITQLYWPAELSRELEKTRGVERQELRYRSYAALWARLRPLALYDATPLDSGMIRTLATDLSDWYFSEPGGLMLTPQTRDFYFALQDLSRATTASPEGWAIDRATAAKADQPALLRAVLRRDAVAGARSIAVLDYLSTASPDAWQDRAPLHARAWRAGLNGVAAAWPELDENERFAVLQQAGSILRTCLANDLDSRLR